MYGWIEIILLAISLGLFAAAIAPKLRAYRSLFGGGAVLALLSAAFPRVNNPLGQFLFGASPGGAGLPVELFGFAWWILGAWLMKSLLDLFLLRTFFPNNDEPHARRLFADLASGLIYFLAFIGIIGTVFKQPVSTFLATSGVVAIVLGLALQNTLGDVIAGLAINIEGPFAAGDWITLSDTVSGQVMQVNWRATRIRTLANDMIVIPNSLASKAILTNHTRPRVPHYCTLPVTVDISAAPARVLEALLTAASIKGHSLASKPKARACAFQDAVILYELAFEIDTFANMPEAKSRMLVNIATVFADQGIRIGAPAMDVHLTKGNPLEVVKDG